MQFAHSVCLQQIGGFDTHIQWGSCSNKKVLTIVLVTTSAQIHILLLTFDDQQLLKKKRKKEIFQPHWSSLAVVLLH